MLQRKTSLSGIGHSCPIPLSGKYPVTMRRWTQYHASAIRPTSQDSWVGGGLILWTFHAPFCNIYWVGLNRSQEKVINLIRRRGCPGPSNDTVGR